MSNPDHPDDLEPDLARDALGLGPARPFGDEIDDVEGQELLARLETSLFGRVAEPRTLGRWRATTAMTRDWSGRGSETDASRWRRGTSWPRPSQPRTQSGGRGDRMPVSSSPSLARARRSCAVAASHECLDAICTVHLAVMPQGVEHLFTASAKAWMRPTSTSP